MQLLYGKNECNIVGKKQNISNNNIAMYLQREHLQVILVTLLLFNNAQNNWTVAILKCYYLTWCCIS
jgi:hypothetical protein